MCLDFHWLNIIKIPLVELPVYTLVYLKLIYIISCACVYTPELLSSCGRQSSIRRPLTQVSRKPLHGSRPHLWAAPYPPYLQTLVLSKFSIFKYLKLVFVFVNMGPYGSKHFKKLLQFSSDLSQPL